MGKEERTDIERLETALANVAHERDLLEEKARLAGEGVTNLDHRIAQLRQDSDKQQAALEHQIAQLRQEAGKQQAAFQRERASAEQELTAARIRLEARDQHLENAQQGLESRDRKLEQAEEQLGARDRELEGLRATVREKERRAAGAESQLRAEQLRAERIERSLLDIRAGSAYKLMRILWRLRRPFRRASRAPASFERGADEDRDPHPVAELSSQPSADSAATRPSARPPFQSRSRDSRQGRLRVAAILDEMSTACFAPECDLIPLTLGGWAEQLDAHRPDLLLVESAWQGNGGEWHYRIAKYKRKDLVGLPALRALVEGCRERGIPTAFWNKEDPIHFDRFAEAAALFDHVFTTDAGCIDRYRELPGERTVSALPFAAQPHIHNPIAAVETRSSSPCFAGAWYRDRHPERRRALEAILDAARPYGLVIYDRTFDSDDPAFGFPERFQPHILGKLPYERILDVYKSHSVFLNANSVVESPTMCSRRVFELAACDTAIVSTPGAGLSALLGDSIAQAEDESTAADTLASLLHDPEERARRTRAARRAVFAEHTYADRLATIAETAGFDASALRQASFALDESSSNGASGSGSESGAPWVLKLQPGLTLSETVLADMEAAAKFADADVIGTRPGRDGDSAVEHRYVDSLDPRAVLIRSDLIAERGWPSDSEEEVHRRLHEWSDAGVRLYAADSDWLVAAGGSNALVGAR